MSGGITRIAPESIIGELTNLGVTHFVVSPGSRSTPLTVAVARHPRAHTTIHFDERGEMVLKGCLFNIYD